MNYKLTTISVFLSAELSQELSKYGATLINLVSAAIISISGQILIKWIEKRYFSKNKNNEHTNN